MARSDINKEPSGNKSSGAPKVAATIRSSYLAELERLFLCACSGEGSPHSRGALTPSNVPRTFSVRLNRFTGTTRADLHCVMEE